jgi:hypothetical protein
MGFKSMPSGIWWDHPVESCGICGMGVSRAWKRPELDKQRLNPLASTDFFGRYNRYYGGGTVVFRGV